jgi:hypothetical protein
MNKQLQYFFENTKQLHILLSIALLLILIVMVAPVGNGLIKYGGQTVVIGILGYILFKNYSETHNFALVQKTMASDRLKKKEEADAKGADTDAKGADAKGADTDAKGEDAIEEPPVTEDNLAGIKNNTVASYILCFFILILLLYVIYSLFD